MRTLCCVLGELALPSNLGDHFLEHRSTPIMRDHGLSFVLILVPHLGHQEVWGKKHGE